MAQSKANIQIASKLSAKQLNDHPLLTTTLEAVLLLLSMLGQAQLSIDNLLGQL